MSKLSELVPTKSPRLMDLVEVAGVDVSDWGNYAKGKNYAAANPKYCYEWSFVEPNKVVVLNLWHDQMSENRDGSITVSLNIREFASQRPPPEKGRALKMDDAIQTAINDSLPIRVIVLGGKRRNISNPSEDASKVSERLLDPETWFVANYNAQNGFCTLKRGATDHFVDQFSMGDESMRPPERHNVSGQAFNRDAEVRRQVLLRANGKCEWCGTTGFITSDGRIYLETHHIIPLSEKGLDRVSNVVALCANHHREAHHGRNKTEMREKLLGRSP